jgi:hypothetical protein
MESWRKVWRAAAPMLTTPQLLALREGLRSDDKALIQGATTTPPPLQCVLDWPCEAGCLFAYAGWKSGLETVGEVEEFFADLCFRVDQELGEPAAVRYLLNWFDDTPRDEMRINLGLEIDRVLANRRVGELSNGAVDVDVSPIPGVDDDSDQPITHTPKE